MVPVRELIQRMQGERVNPHQRECFIEYQLSLPDALRLLVLGDHRAGLRQSILAYLKKQHSHTSLEECSAIIAGHVSRIRRAYGRG
jgi:hypothetical protein